MKFKVSSHKNMTVITKVGSGKESTMIHLRLLSVCLSSVRLLHSQISVTFLILFLLQGYSLPTHPFLSVVVFLLIMTKGGCKYGYGNWP
jgi:hypothetical protein